MPLNNLYDPGGSNTLTTTDSVHNLGSLKRDYSDSQFMNVQTGQYSQEYYQQLDSLLSISQPPDFDFAEPKSTQQSVSNQDYQSVHFHQDQNYSRDSERHSARSSTSNSRSGSDSQQFSPVQTQMRVSQAQQQRQQQGRLQGSRSSAQQQVVMSLYMPRPSESPISPHSMTVSTQPSTSPPRQSSQMPVDMTTASAVAVRGAKIYMNSSNINAGSNAQSIFHSNPELDSRVSAAIALQQPSSALYTPQDRSLPVVSSLSENTTADEIEDVYVQFILYCNPSIPTDVETADLRRAIHNVPKSDGKAFPITRLFELLRQFDIGEVKTWTRLVTELGVERTPEQSAQKVQQYAVRLKRWMRAMHIDSFFEFCMGKRHPYFTQIPDSSRPLPEIRDGVPTEEDLALRALLPEMRQRRQRSGATSPVYHQPDLIMSPRMRADIQLSGPSSGLPLDQQQTEHSSSSSASVVSTSSQKISGKRRKRHGPAVSSTWISQDPAGRGRPVSTGSSGSGGGGGTSGGMSNDYHHQHQQDGDQVEALVSAIVERGLRATTAFERDAHVHQVAEHVVRAFRSGFQSSPDPAAFTWVFGGLENASEVEFAVSVERVPESGAEADVLDAFVQQQQQQQNLAHINTYVVSWQIEVGGAQVSFERRVDVADADAF
ncbi:ARS binding protein 2-domain-containing protein [Lipomyces arxii]|uniref:ARS binding protein 2-domain-containing protein n=1 Tax=Lipomyces arxii TaxID=56418 RepID=UPI0034CD9BF5